MFSFAAYIGPFHHRKNPLLRLMPRVYLAGKETPYFLMALAPLTDRGAQTPQQIGFPERALLDKELIEKAPSSRKAIDFDPAARRILASYADVPFSPGDDLSTPPYYQEGTSLFSGPEVQRQVAVFSLCAGANLPVLPALKPASGAAWFSFSKLLDAVRQTGRQNARLWSADSSPFVLKDLVPDGHAQATALPALKIAATDLYLLERLSLFKFVSGTSANRPPNRAEWVPETDILAALRKLEGGRYGADERLENENGGTAAPKERYNTSSFRKNYQCLWPL